MSSKNILGGGRLLGISGAALALLAGLMLFPALPEQVSAEEANTKVSLTVNPVIGIALDEAVTVEVLPTAEGTFSSNKANLSVTTNNETGYSLYLATTNGENTLTSNNPSTTETINAITLADGTDSIPSSDFTNNTWGYNLSTGDVSASDSTTYKPVPTTNGTTPINTPTEAPTEGNGDTYSLIFGTKINTALPSGTYSNDVVVSVVANPEYVPTISAMTNMQDVTAEICTASADGETATLTDTRDSNTYTVAKINGNCWMTQNLRISSTTESGGSRVLTSADSNVTSNWTFPNNSLRSGDTNYIGKSYTEAGSVISDDPEHATEYGGYYNYCAASAGTVCNDTTKQNAAQDICPKGWRLPTLNEMNGITSYRSAFSPVYSGGYSNGSLYDTGSYGRWWSATASRSSSGSQYYLYYYGGSLSAVDSGKHFGYSVRCVRSSPGTLTINFDGNGSTGGSTASQQIAAGNTAPLNANGFTRNGYVFTGWNTAADGSGTSYADGAEYAVTPATGDVTVTLYAQWEAFGKDTMQGFTLSDCQQQASGGQVTLRDVRDNNTYTVRYINGACWMTQNLRLSGGRKLTPADSDVTSNWDFPNNSLRSDDTNYIGNSYTEAGFAIDSNTSYGGYYNLCAASAGDNCSDSDSSNSTNSICPAGWDLPTRAQFSDITNQRSAFSPVYSGDYVSGSLLGTGSYGRWWSATANSSIFQYLLDYDNGSLNAVDYGSKLRGLPVRCIRSS